MNQAKSSCMKIRFVDLDEQVINALKAEFSPLPGDFSFTCASIIEMESLSPDSGLVALVSPANSLGFMDGGVDQAYLNHFGDHLQKRVQTHLQEHFYGELPVGQATTVNLSKQRYLIVAPTMRRPTSVKETLNAYLAFRAVLIEALEFNKANSDNPAVQITEIRCPGFCTGVGKMRPAAAALQMAMAWCQVYGIKPCPL